MVTFGFFGKKKIKDIEIAFDKYPDHIITLDKNNFNDFINKYPLSLIDFWASWCVPCKAMAPKFRRLSKIYKDKMAFGRLDTQNNKEIAESYRIRGIPNLIFFTYGKKIGSYAGLKSISNFKKIIEQHLEKYSKP